MKKCRFFHLLSWVLLSTFAFSPSAFADGIGEDNSDDDEYDLIDRNWDRADFNPYDYPENRRNGHRRGRHYHIDKVQSKQQRNQTQNNGQYQSRRNQSRRNY